MPASTLITFDEIRDNIAKTIIDTQIEQILSDYINVTLAQIWNAYPWTFKRRKATFSTVVSQEDYNLDEEIDQIVVIRQRTTPLKLLYVPDRLFYQLEPDPEGQSTGIPRYYRLWEETGFSTNLAAADTIYVSSSSTSDGSSFRVILVGRNSSGEVVSESLTLNGTTSVTSSTTWAASGLMQVSKSGQTTGTITVYRTTGATVLSELSPEDRAPRYKRLSLYPIPSSAITLYVEYFERLRYLVNNADVPQMDHKWIWVLREGALAKAWTYKRNEVAAEIAKGNFDEGLRLMRLQDEANYDYVPVLQPRQVVYSTIRRTADSVSNAFPSYSLQI